MSPAIHSSLILCMVHICIALYYPHLENGTCSIKGGLCLPSNAVTCNPLDAECDEGNICCEVPSAVPIKDMVSGKTVKQSPATCTGTQEIDAESGATLVMWSESNYENDLDCGWQITVEPGNVILIEWVNFELEYHSDCFFDYVEILGDKFCGDSMPDSITSTSNQVLIKFYTDYSETRKGFTLTFSSVPTAATTTTSPGCGRVNRQIRIVEGEETEVHEYPWQVALVGYGSIRPHCGGSILSRRWILTAAHCLGACITATDIHVVVGEHNWSTNDETTFTIRVDVEELVIHPSYNSITKDHDIALIKLKSELSFTHENRIAPVCLPVGSQDLFENVDAIVSGWGLHSVTECQPDVLHNVTVSTMSNEPCRQTWESLNIDVTDNMICTRQPGSIKGPFKGDSGGPLVTEYNSYMTQIGVVSWGHPYLNPGYPAVYTRVTNHMSWILGLVDDFTY